MSEVVENEMDFKSVEFTVLKKSLTNHLPHVSHVLHPGGEARLAQDLFLQHAFKS